MKIRKRIWIPVVIVVALLLVAAGAYAASTYGTESDPLIAKSYLDTAVMPELQAEMQSQLDSAKSQMQGGNSGEFSVITLSSGQKVVCDVGCEILLRIGTASAVGADYPVLVDTTSADSLSDGSQLAKNHLYICTIQGNGFKATAATVKVLISGSYTIQ